MHNVLLMYKQLTFEDFMVSGEKSSEGDEQVVRVLSYDEKPGIQAIANTSEDLRPDARHSTISRDYEYRRPGKLSLLA